MTKQKDNREKIAIKLRDIMPTIILDYINGNEIIQLQDMQIVADQILAIFPDKEEARKDGYKLGVEHQHKAQQMDIEEAKKQEKERITKDIYSIEFESNSATDFLNKTLYYIRHLKEEK